MPTITIEVQVPEDSNVTIQPKVSASSEEAEVEAAVAKNGQKEQQAPSDRPISTKTWQTIAELNSKLYDARENEDKSVVAMAGSMVDWLKNEGWPEKERRAAERQIAQHLPDGTTIDDL